MSTPESNVWDAPVKDVTAPDPPAPSSEPVENAPAAAEQQGQTQEGQPAPAAQPQPATPAPAQALDWTTAPQAFREAHEAEKPLRELAKEVGGLEVLREAVELDDLLRNPTVEVRQKLERLRSVSEAEFERMGGELVEWQWQKPEWQDHLLQQRFGKSAAEIEQALHGGTQSQPQQQPLDPLAVAREILADPLASGHDKALAQFAISQAEKQPTAPTLDPKVEERLAAFDRLQEERQTEQRNALAGEFLRQAFDPVEEVVKEAFPVVAGETAEDAQRRERNAERLREEVFNNLYTRPLANPNHPNYGLAKEIDGYLKNLDRGNLVRKLPKVRALVEIAAQTAAADLSATYSQKLRVQSQPLEREPNPPVVNGQGASFGSSDAIPQDAWNDPNMSQHWQEIAQQVR